MPNRRLPILAALILGFCLAGMKGLAAGAQITTRFGFGEYVVPRRWAPLRVRLDMEPVESTAIEVAGRNTVEVFPCVGGGGWVECPVLVDESDGEIRVRLVADGRVLAEQALDSRRKVFSGHLILAIELPIPAQQAIEQSLAPQEPVKAVSLAIEDLPRLGLDYDAVSAVVLVDPGPVLSPAQKRAMHAWLAGGGRLVLLKPRPGAESLASLIAASKRTAGAGLEALQVGLGKLVFVPSAHADFLGQASWWRRTLALAPYASSARLTASQSLPDDESRRTNPPTMPKALGLIMAGWAAAAVSIAPLARRKALAWYALFTLACLMAAVPAGKWLDGKWHRGISIEERAIILPEAAGTLIGYRVLAPDDTVWREFGIPSSPWGADLSLGQTGEKGSWKGATGRAEWRHGHTPSLGVARAALNALSLAGYQPGVPMRVLMAPDRFQIIGPLRGRRVGVWDGLRWRIPEDDGAGGARWRETATCPAWLEGNRVWLARLFQSYPVRAWLVGKGPLPIPAMAVEGVTCADTCWVWPVTDEVEP